MRADAQRNYDRIVAAADELVARDGADVSLEEVARRAGVGSATLHRRFPGRLALLQAVFHGRVEELGRRAGELAETGTPGESLTTWLHELGAYVTSTRGLAALLTSGETLDESESCNALMVAAGQRLVTQAQEAGTVRPEVSAADLVTLVSAISLAAPDAPDQAGRLLDLALTGIGPVR